MNCFYDKAQLFLLQRDHSQRCMPFTVIDFVVFAFQPFYDMLKAAAVYEAVMSEHESMLVSSLLNPKDHSTSKMCENLSED